MSVKETPNVKIPKEATVATVSTDTKETCVRTSTSAPVQLNVILRPSVKILMETTLVAAIKDTMELGLLDGLGTGFT